MLSDLYAMGVEHCDNVLMLLGVSEMLNRKQRDVVTPLVIQGFNGIQTPCELYIYETLCF